MKIIKIGYLLLIIGTILTVKNTITERKELIIENNKVESTLQKEVGYYRKNIEDTYDGVLLIPQINLKKGIYEKDDTRNNIEENVTIHHSSNYPNEKNSNLILIAHSGTGKKAFFNRINELNNDSLIEFYYQRVKYVYKISNYYTIEKNGYAKIKRDNTKKTVTLITCSKDDKTKQLVYIGYLIDEIKY